MLDIDENKIIKVFLENNSNAKKTLKFFNFSKSTLYKILKRNNIELINRYSGRFIKCHQRNKITLPEKDIINEYVNNDLSSTEIALKFNCNNKTILRILRENNIKIKIGRFQRGHKVWSEGLTKEIDDRLKKQSDLFKELQENEEFGYKKGHKPSEDTRKKQSEIRIKLFENGYINPMSGRHLLIESIKKRFNSLKLRPTSFEKKISELCIKYGLPFIYSGNGTFLIGHKNPDFVNKEKRIAIEVFYSYFKKKQFGSVEEYMKQRAKYFSKYGYKTIFITEKEILNKNWEDICLNKIKILT